MTEEEAAEFARGMLGPYGAISFMAESGSSSCVIGLVERGHFVGLGVGASWEEAANDAVDSCNTSAMCGYGPWEVPF